MLKLKTTRVVLGLAIFYGFQFFFPIGFYILWFPIALAGPYAYGFLPHLVTLALILDVYQNGLSKKVLPVLGLLYVSYYAFYFYEGVIIRSVENDIIVQNSKQIMDFDPSTQALVMSGGEGLITYYKLPVVYEENNNFPEGYLSYRLISAEKCRQIDSIKRDTFVFRTFGVTWQRGKNVSDYKRLEQCELVNQEKPRREIIAISTNKKDEFIDGIEFTQTTRTVTRNGQAIGTLRSAVTDRLAAFPFLAIGCELSPPSYRLECGAGLIHSMKVLRTADDSAVSKYGNDLIAIAFKFEKYREADFSNFKDYPENTAFIDEWLSMKRNETANDFNEWGVRKDSLYLPKIEMINGIEHYKGVVYTRAEGGPFYDFIKRNEGKMVFIDTTFTSRNRDEIDIRLCKKEGDICRELCGAGPEQFPGCGGISHYYSFREGMMTVNIPDRITGFWKVSAAEILGTSEDTKTVLSMAPNH